MCTYIQRYMMTTLTSILSIIFEMSENYSLRYTLIMKSLLQHFLINPNPTNPSLILFGQIQHSEGLRAARQNNLRLSQGPGIPILSKSKRFGVEWHKRRGLRSLVSKKAKGVRVKLNQMLCDLQRCFNISRCKRL